jgi:hypothetical protein
MIRAALPLLVATLLAAAPAFAQTAAAGRFKRDPFDWTSLQQAAKKREPDAAKAAAAPERTPRLRAVMRGPSGDQVNLGGVIMSIGESAEGYRLVEVRDYSAVFARKGGTVELEVSREQVQ